MDAGEAHIGKSPRAQPVTTGERLVSLDLIRGIAVLGILLANVTGFGHPDIAYYWPLALPDGGNLADRMVWLVQFVVVDGKLRGLFTILFGAGLVLFVERIQDRGRALVLQTRRLFWLLLFGMAHFYLLFRGDILFSYGCAGLLALFALSWSAERLLAIGIIWALLGGALQVLTYLTPVLVEAGTTGAAANGQAVAHYSAFWTTQLTEAALQKQLVLHGTYWDILRFRVLGESHILYSYFTYCFFETIPLMLIGMGLYRNGVFAGSDLGRDSPQRNRLAWAAVAAGTLLNLAIGLAVYARGFPPYLTQMAFFGLLNLANIPVLLGGSCLLADWASRPHSGWLAQRLVLAGRMAFTNYIGTSLVMVLMFQGWAGGLYGQLHRLDMLLVVALGWALMLTLSRVWLARFRYGPLEYCWRCLTYWRLFPMRRPLVEEGSADNPEG